MIQHPSDPWRPWHRLYPSRLWDQLPRSPWVPLDQSPSMRLLSDPSDLWVLWVRSIRSNP